MKAWCINRNEYTVEEQQRLLDVAVHFGATESEKAEQYSSGLADLPFVGVRASLNTYISKNTINYEGNLITYNEAFELVTGLKTRDAYIKEYFGKKYKTDPEQSAWLQELVFSLGGKWASESTAVMFTNSKYIYISDDGDITRGTDEDYFDLCGLSQGNLDECNAELGKETLVETKVTQPKDIISTEELASAAKELDLVFEINSSGLTAFDRNDKEYSLNAREDFESLVDAMKVIKRLCNP